LFFNFRVGNVAAGGIPFWLGGGASAPNLRRLAEWCDGWIPIPINGATANDVIADIRQGLPKIQSAWRDHGRDPSQLQVSVGLPLVRGPESRHSDLRLSLDNVPDHVAAGATDISVPLHAFCREFDRVPQFLDGLVAQFRQATSPDRVDRAVLPRHAVSRRPLQRADVGAIGRQK
jgi:alkanesulfonate monooxygenase SsuD/methylene tetrahydromethanopterin reductase-like flavin-dependent oxidoreductase (luciferase family)